MTENGCSLSVILSALSSSRFKERLEAFMQLQDALERLHRPCDEREWNRIIQAVLRSVLLEAKSGHTGIARATTMLKGITGVVIKNYMVQGALDMLVQGLANLVTLIDDHDLLSQSLHCLNTVFAAHPQTLLHLLCPHLLFPKLKDVLWHDSGENASQNSAERAYSQLLSELSRTVVYLFVAQCSHRMSSELHRAACGFLHEMLLACLRKNDNVVLAAVRASILYLDHSRATCKSVYLESQQMLAPLLLGLGSTKSTVVLEELYYFLWRHAAAASCFEKIKCAAQKVIAADYEKTGFFRAKPSTQLRLGRIAGIFRRATTRSSIEEACLHTLHPSRARSSTLPSNRRACSRLRIEGLYSCTSTQSLCTA